MITLSFVRGGSLRRASINERKISFASQETGFVPMFMDLDKIDEKEIIKKMGRDGLEFIKDIQELKKEDDMAIDIIKDFRRTGWRLIKREDGSN